MNTPDPLDSLVLALRAVPAREISFPIRRKPRRIGRVLTPLALASGIALAALALRPTPALGWDGAVARSESALVRRITEVDPDGTVRAEFWVAPDRFAYWYRPAWRRDLYAEMRYDGRRIYRFQAPVPTAKGPNRRTVGSVRTLLPKSSFGRWSFPPPTLDAFATSKGMDVREVRDSKGTAYRVRARKAVRVHSSPTESAYRHETYTVRLDAKGRIGETITEDGYRTLYGYPDAIPEATFAPRPQARIVPVVDADAVRREAERRVRRGLVRRGGLTVRLVTLDDEGAAWVFWTRPGKAGSRAEFARLVGHPGSRSFGTPEFLQPKAANGRRGLAPSLGKRLFGNGATTTREIGGTVDLDVPTARGRVRFRSVPVLRVASLADVSAVVGL